MKGILRSKSPSGENGSAQPKSILKRHNPDDDQKKESSRTSSSSEDLVVSAENDLAAKLLSVEKEAKNQIDVKPSEPPKESVTVHQEEKQQSQSLASRKEM